MSKARKAKPRKYNKTLNRLTALTVKRAKGPPWRLHDGGGLYLDISRKGNNAKSFTFQDMKDGKRRWIGLGPYLDGKGVTLADARQQRDKLRHLIAHGGDPIEEKKRQHLAKVLAAAKSI